MPVSSRNLRYNSANSNSACHYLWSPHWHAQVQVTMPIAIWAQRITVRCNNWHRQHASHFLGNIRLDGLACARSDANGAQNCFSSSLGIRRTLRHSASIPMAEWTDHSMGLETAHAHTNRLANEESPYLLQHQHNPVRFFRIPAKSVC